MMRFRTVLFAGTAAMLGVISAPTHAQTITENVNNTGLPGYPRQAPALSLSNIYGLNPCSTGTSVGVTTPLFGIGGAMSNIDRECETRNNAAVVITGLKDETLAREILCTITDIRQAAVRVGKPCLQDQPRVAAVSSLQSAPWMASATQDNAAPPQVSQASQVSQVSQVNAAPAQPNTVAAVPQDAPAFCRTSGLVVSLYPECTGPAVQARLSKPATDTGRATTVPARRPVAPQPAASHQPEVTTQDFSNKSGWVKAISYTPPQQATPAAPSSPATRVAKLMERGSAMVASGDVIAARLFFERAADAGNAEAAEAVAQTYDAAFLARIQAVGVQADPAKSVEWHRRATDMTSEQRAAPARMASR